MPLASDERYIFSKFYPLQAWAPSYKRSVMSRYFIQDFGFQTLSSILQFSAPLPWVIESWWDPVCAQQLERLSWLGYAFFICRCAEVGSD